MTLTTNAITLSVGASQHFVDWNGYIGQLSDDKDDRSRLFGNVVKEGNPDLSK